MGVGPSATVVAEAPGDAFWQQVPLPTLHSDLPFVFHAAGTLEPPDDTLAAVARSIAEDETVKLATRGINNMRMMTSLVPVDVTPLVISCVVELQSIIKLALPYHCILDKRQILLRHVARILLRKRDLDAKNSKLITSVDAPESKTPKHTQHAQFLAIRLFLSLVQSTARHVPAVANDLLASFLAIVADLPANALRDGALLPPLHARAADAMWEWMMSLAHPENPMAALVDRASVVSGLLAMAVATGSLRFLLATVDVARTGVADTVIPGAGRVLAALLDQTVECPLSIDLSNSQRFTVNFSPAGDAHRDTTSIATDGVFLYILESGRLYKIGTGFGHTCPGRVYYDRKVVTAEAAQLLCAGDALYIRCASIAPAVFLKLSAATLEAHPNGDLIHHDGKGALASEDNTRFTSFRAYSAEAPVAVTCDGRYIYMIGMVDGRPMVDLFDPLAPKPMKHVGRVMLADNTLAAGDWLLQGCFYTNGHFIAGTLQAPWGGTAGNPVADGRRLRYVASLRTGEVITNDGDTKKPRYVTYDPVNNVIWMYTTGVQVEMVLNRGAPAVASALVSPLHPESILSNDDLGVDVFNPTGRQLALMALAQADYLGSFLGPPASPVALRGWLEEREGEGPLLERALTFDVSLQTFDTLLTLLEHGAQTVEKDESVHAFYPLAAVVRLIRVNVFHLNNSRLAPHLVGFTPAGAVLNATSTGGRIFLRLLSLVATLPATPYGLLVRNECITTLASGLAAFLPDVDERLTLLRLLSDSDGALTVSGVSFSLPAELIGTKRTALLDALINELPRHTRTHEIVAAVRSNWQRGKKVDLDGIPATSTLKAVAELAHVMLRREFAAQAEAARALLVAPADRIAALSQLRQTGGVRFLAHLQRELLVEQHDAEDTEAAAMVDGMLLSYVRVLLGGCMQFAAAILPETRGMSGEHAAGLRRLVETSLMGQLLPSLCAALGASPPSLTVCAALTEPLAAILKALIGINTGVEVFHDEDKVLNTTPWHSHKPQVAVAESTHPYAKNQNKEYNIHVPGCRGLVVEFDSHCSTPNADNYVQFYRKVKRTDEMPNMKFHGKGFPTERFYIKGDTLVIYFHTQDATPVDWGFRCLVYGYRECSPIKNFVPALLDLEKSISYVAGQFLAALLVGDGVAPEEDEARPWIALPLFNGGVAESIDPAETEFCEALIHGEGQSPGAALGAWIQDQLRSEANQRDGNPGARRMLPLSRSFHASLNEVVAKDKNHVEELDMAERAVAAALMRHNGIVPATMAQTSVWLQDPERPPVHLVKIWRMAHKVRKWLVERHREHLQTLPIDAEERSRHTYMNALCARVIAKARLLLLLAPALAAPAPEYDYTALYDPATPRSPASMYSLWRAVAASTPARSGPASPDAKSGSPFPPVSPRGEMSGAGVAASASAGAAESQHSEISRAVVRFVQDALAPSIVSEALIHTKKRAQYRALGYTLLDGLLQTTGPSRSATQSLLLSLADTSTPLAAANEERAAEAHYLSHLQGCGSALLKGVQDAFGKLFHTAIGLLGQQSDRVTRILAHCVLDFRWETRDYHLLREANVLERLGQMISYSELLDGVALGKSNDSESDFHSRLCKASMYSVTLLVITAVADNSDSTEAAQLRVGLTEMVMQQIKDAAVQPTSSSVAAHHYANYLSQMLIYLFQLGSTRAAAECLSDMKHLSFLVGLLERDLIHPRVRDQLTRLLRLLLPIARIDDSQAEGHQQRKRIVSNLLEAVGRAGSGIPRTTEAGDGSAKYTITSYSAECIMLVRTLATSASWRPTVVATVTEALADVPRLLAEDLPILNPVGLERLTSLHMAMAALHFMGGFVETLRLGGRAEYTTDGGVPRVCTVIDVHREDVYIALDNVATEAIKVTHNSLAPLPEIAFTGDMMPFSKELLPAYSALLTQPPADAAYAHSLQYAHLRQAAFRTLPIFMGHGDSVRAFLATGTLLPIMASQALLPRKGAASVREASTETWEARAGALTDALTEGKRPLRDVTGLVCKIGESINELVVYTSTFDPLKVSSLLVTEIAQPTFFRLVPFPNVAQIFAVKGSLGFPPGAALLLLSAPTTEEIERLRGLPIGALVVCGATAKADAALSSLPLPVVWVAPEPANALHTAAQPPVNKKPLDADTLLVATETGPPSSAKAFVIQVRERQEGAPATPSSEATPAPTEAATPRPAAPAAAPAAPPVDDATRRETLDGLAALGFPMSWCERALERSNDANFAAIWLLENAERLGQEDEAERVRVAAANAAAAATAAATAAAAKAAPSTPALSAASPAPSSEADDAIDETYYQNSEFVLPSNATGPAATIGLRDAVTPPPPAAAPTTATPTPTSTTTGATLSTRGTPTRGNPAPPRPTRGGATTTTPPTPNAATTSAAASSAPSAAAAAPPAAPVGTALANQSYGVLDSLPGAPTAAVRTLASRVAAMKTKLADLALDSIRVLALDIDNYVICLARDALMRLLGRVAEEPKSWEEAGGMHCLVNLMRLTALSGTDALDDEGMGSLSSLVKGVLTSKDEARARDGELRLLAEAAFHLATSAAPVSRDMAATIESKHPHEGGIEVIYHVQAPNVRAVKVLVDARLALADKASLVIYSGPNKTNELVRMEGKSSMLTPFIMPQSEMYFHFNAPPGTAAPAPNASPLTSDRRLLMNQWGYKIMLVPHIFNPQSEGAALGLPSPVLGCWLIDMVLAAMGTSRTLPRATFDALLEFATNCAEAAPGSPLSGRALSLLRRALACNIEGRPSLRNDAGLLALANLTTRLHTQMASDHMPTQLAQMAETLMVAWTAEAPATDGADAKGKGEAAGPSTDSPLANIPWLHQLAEASQLARAVDKTTPFPQDVLQRAWMDTLEKETVTVQSRHPYRKAQLRGKVHMEDTESLLVTFTGESSSEPGDMLLLSRDAEGKIPCGSAGGRTPWTSIVVQGDTFHYQFPGRAVTVYAWGDGTNGKLGVGDGSAPAKVPTRVTALDGVTVLDVSCGDEYTGVLTVAGAVYTFGKGNYGRLGHGGTSNERVPRLVEALSGERIVVLACGRYHTAAVSATGALYTWGDGDNNKLGYPGGSSKPELVTSLTDVRDVACGPEYTVACTKDGRLWTWGRGDYGVLGSGADRPIRVPTVVESMREHNVVQVVAGNLFAGCRTATGLVFTWGDGDYGKLGHGDTTAKHSPTLVQALRNTPIKRLVAFRGGSIGAIGEAGEVFLWGRGHVGQLGHGNTENATLPRQVAALAGMNVVDLGVGGLHSVAVTDAGDLYVWGSGANYRLGLNSEANFSTPQLLPATGDASIVRLSCGESHTLAVTGWSIAHGVNCTQCSRLITSARYLCTHCNQSLCASCDANPNTDHNVEHISLVVRSPLPSSAPRFVLPALPAAPVDPESQHRFACSNCRAELTAPVYICVNCDGSYALCATCEPSALDIHGDGHIFARLRLPVSEDGMTLLRAALPMPICCGESTDYGFSFTAIPTYNATGMRQQVSRNTASFSSFCTDNEAWPVSHDELLVEVANALCVREKRTPASLVIPQFTPSATDLASAERLATVPLAGMQRRLRVLQLVNQQLLGVIHMVDFTQTDETALASVLARIRGSIFWSTKQKLWTTSLAVTMHTGDPIPISVDRIKASQSAARGLVDHTGSFSLFGQMYQGLQTREPKVLRRSERPWKVQFKGEHSDDFGGPYRESLTGMCVELQSAVLPLLLRSPKGDKFLLNPASSSATHLSMYSFIGKLMGVALRTRDVLNLDLAASVWKQLVGQPLNRDDLLDVDPMCVTVLNSLRDSENITRENFADCFPDAMFTTIASDGREVELKPGGATIPVTFDTRHEFASLMEKYKLTEGKKQADAIRQGLATIVPRHLLRLFTWQELELHVCGRPDVDLALLKSRTVYKGGVQATDAQVQYLWQVLEGMAPHERCAFLRFVWGRTRLPLTAGDFPRDFAIQPFEPPRRASPDLYHPVAHTCFFSIDLPAYSSAQVLREKLLYAITHSPTIDIDNVAAVAAEWIDE